MPAEINHGPDQHRAMLQSLECIAARDIDIVPRFFTRFFAAYPAERERFCNRTSSEGLMVNEMLSMLLASAAAEPWLATMMRAQVNTHHDHGDIAIDQYAAAFAMLVDVLREASGEHWIPAAEAAWQAHASALLEIVTRYH